MGQGRESPWFPVRSHLLKPERPISRPSVLRTDHSNTPLMPYSDSIAALTSSGFLLPSSLCLRMLTVSLGGSHPTQFRWLALPGKRRRGQIDRYGIRFSVVSKLQIAAR